jgi:hypothetical protein
MSIARLRLGPVALVVGVAGLTAFVIVVSHWYLFREDVAVEPQAFDLELRRRLVAASVQGDEMAERHDYLGAAIQSADVAAAKEVLLSPGSGVSRSSRPSRDELHALMQFTAAGERDVYEALLRLKYPNWSPSEPNDAQIAPAEG